MLFDNSNPFDKVFGTDAKTVTTAATPPRPRKQKARSRTEAPVAQTDARSPRKTPVAPRKEPNITAVRNKDGGTTWRVQIRSRKGGSLTRTFVDLAMAKKWRDKTKLEISANGFPSKARGERTVADVIARRLEVHDYLGRSSRQMLNNVAERGFGALKTHEVSKSLLYALAEELGQNKSPQTVAAYMSVLAKTLEWGARRDEAIQAGEVREAMSLMWEDRLLARSAQRTRRPSLEELDRILTLCSTNRRQRTPLVTVIAFAIFSTRRLGEICRLRWADLDLDQSRILVRDMKHPRSRVGNDVWCRLPEEALKIIKTMPREEERIFPFEPRSIGTAFARHVTRAGIEDLRFHDLRHEGITRQFEMGETAPFVAKISGHRSSAMLDRYEHVIAPGDRYAGWPWLSRVLAGEVR